MGSSGPASGKFVVGCHWVYIVKQKPDGTIDKLKNHLVAKGYRQTYGVDFFETFSHVARLNSVCIIISVATHYD